MSRDRYSYSYAHASRSSLIQRALLVLLVITGVTLLVLARSHHPVATKMRAQMLGMVSPALSAMSKPFSGFHDLMTNKDALFNAFEENKQLREENDNLRHWQAVAQALKAENESLRALAGYQPVEQVSYVTARVIGQSPTAYGASVAINTGAEDGLKNFQPVVDAHGLIGRVVDVSDHHARVLLLTDSSSRVPVITGTSRKHAILAGTGDELLQLTFLGGDATTIALGEPVVTTEEGGLIPGGVMIGTVFRRDETGLLVKPVRPLAQSEYVRVIVSK